MSSDLAVCFDNVSKQFPNHSDTNWRAALPWNARQPDARAALSDVVLDVPRGQALGIIGPNGAGKTTLLKLLARVLAPTRGTVSSVGRLSAMIELGLGFHPALTGRQNIIVAGTLLGTPALEVRELVPAIAHFAELEDVLDVPVREYSTGMVARLGFATATHLQTDVLVIDEVLSVGDHRFQEKCLERITRNVGTGTTLLFVSHELPLVRTVCDRVVVLRDGRLVDDGPAGRVIESYIGKRRSPAAVGEPTAVISHLGLRSEVLDPWESIEFDTEIVVHAPSDLAELQITLSLPTVDPDLVIVEESIAIPPDLRGPGRFRIGGRSTPVPLVGGHLQFTAALLTSGRTALSRESRDFRMTGPIRALKPMYPLDLGAELTRSDGPGRPARRTHTASPRDGRIVLRLDGVTKSYAIDQRGAALRDAVPGPVVRSRRPRSTAVDDLSLEVHAGQSVGLIGPNGAGKSTLLRCIAGLTELDSGTVRVFGHAVPVLELGVGFRPDFSGWENLSVTGALLGLSRDALNGLADEIVEFSGVADAMGLPMRQWSTGMRARLGFALASHLPCDVLLIDELLAVGDLTFRRRAVAKVNELCSTGTAVVLVSHDLQLITEVCDRAIRLEQGRAVDDGPAHSVVERYGGVGWSGGSHLGLGPVRLHDLQLRQPRIASGERAHISATVEVTSPSPHLRLELSIRDPAGAEDPELLSGGKLELYTMGTGECVSEGSLRRPGWYGLEIETNFLKGSGEVHVVLSAVDGREGTYVAETWTTLVLADGRPGRNLPGAFDFSIEPSIERISTTTW